MKKNAASLEDIERAIYLAALSQFCIFNPFDSNKHDWPLRDGDPLHRSAMTKQTCTMTDFHRTLRARDPLGWGFESSETLLHLIWQLLDWDPKTRMTVSDALNHPYFNPVDSRIKSDPIPGEHNALESQMLDPRMDFNVSDSISEFACPQCGRIFSDWKSCHTHANSRKHSKFCFYDRRTLPSCLNSHAMLPAHSFSGYCDIQGRRRTIEDFHSIKLLKNQQFYGIFDGHLGNYASKYAASFLYDEVSTRLAKLTMNHSIPFISQDGQ
jgi:serine/threonine protein kinase